MSFPTYTTTRSYGGACPPSYLVGSLPASYSAGQAFTLHSAANWYEVSATGQATTDPLGTSGPFVVVLDFSSTHEEKVLCSSVNVTTGVVTVWTDGTNNGRGYDGTTISSHSPGNSGNPNVFPVATAVENRQFNTGVSTAITNAANAQSTANTALANAATAQSTANTAEADAQTAIANAASAQSTANTALSNASTAQSTANTAVTNAATAQSTANTALANAATAQSTADAKVASVTAADGTITIAGTTQNPTIKVNAISESQVTNLTTDLAGKVNTSAVGAANGVASLDGSGLVPSNQIPPIAITETFVVNSQAAMLALTAQVGDVAVRTDINTTFILQTSPPSTLANWVQMLSPGGGVTSIATSSPITGGPITGTGTIGIQSASTTQSGAVQLNDTVSSTSTTQAATANAVKQANDNANTKLPLSGGTLTGALNGTTATFTGEVKGSDFAPTGLTGATAATRYVGGTTAGAPTSGTFAVGDWVMDQQATLWVCIIAGTPGTWSPVPANSIYKTSASRTAALGEITLVQGSGTGVTITLPANPTAGSTYGVINSANNAISIKGGSWPLFIGGTTYGAGTSYSVAPNGVYSFVFSDNADNKWYAMSTNDIGDMVNYSDVAVSKFGAATANVAMGGFKITGLANGTASTDAAAFGQIPTSLPPSGSAGGDLTGTYPNPTLATAYSGASSVGSATAVPVLTVDTKGRITASSTAAPLDATKLPLAGGTMSGAIAMGSNKITGLANGTVATDAAAFGQIPTSLPPSGSAGGDLTGTYPNPTLATAYAGASSVGSATAVPVLTVDTKGRITATSTAAPLDATKLPLAGGTMSGAIAMGSNKITGLANGTASTDAINLSQHLAQVLTPTVKTTTYTAAAGDFVVMNGTGNINVTLPTAPANGSVVGLLNIQASGTTTLVAGGSDTLAASSTSAAGSTVTQYQTLVVVYNSSNTSWYPIVADAGKPYLNRNNSFVGSNTFSNPVTINNAALNLTGTAALSIPATGTGIAMNANRITNLAAPGATTDPARAGDIGATVPPINHKNSLNVTLKGWSYDPAMSTGGSRPGSTTIYYTQVIVPYATTITGVFFFITAAGTSVTAGNIGLYNSTTQLASVSATAQFQGSGLQNAQFASPPSVTAGTYWVAFTVTGTAPPNLANSGGVDANLTNANITMTANTLNGRSSSLGTTTLPATISGTPTAVSALYWFGVF